MLALPLLITHCPLGPAVSAQSPRPLPLLWPVPRCQSGKGGGQPSTPTFYKGLGRLRALTKVTRVPAQPSAIF